MFWKVGAVRQPVAGGQEINMVTGQVRKRRIKGSRFFQRLARFTEVLV